MVMVDFPSPAGVGLIAVTKISFPTGFSQLHESCQSSISPCIFHTIQDHRLPNQSS